MVLIINWHVFKVSLKEKDTVVIIGDDGEHGTLVVDPKKVDIISKRGIMSFDREFMLCGKPGYSRNSVGLFNQWLATKGAPDLIDITEDFL